MTVAVRFNVFVGEETIVLEVPDAGLGEAAPALAKMDRDMDGGWQMSREYVEHLDTHQRCQIVADRLLTSIMNGKKSTSLMMAAYILARVPGVTGVDIDTSGEIQNTELVF